MSDVQVPIKIKSLAVEAKVIRADGKEEDLGKIAYWEQPNFLQRILNKVIGR